MSPYSKQMLAEQVLKVRDLQVTFTLEDGLIHAVDGVSFEIYRGETLGVVGESGCGKSVSSLALMGLLPAPFGRVTGGEAFFRGVSLFKKSESEMQAMRGKDMAMIFQEPMTSLNPLYTIGNQLAEVFHNHEGLDWHSATHRATEMLAMVGIPSPEKRITAYPHELSGGMRQRVMIAMAISCNPVLLIADEPTTALDVTIQAQILDLMRNLQDRLHMAIMLISHDLGVIAEMARRVMVMYAGRVVEYGMVEDIFDSPRHPYTQGLLASIPLLDEKKERLQTIPGVVPPLSHLPQGCAFHPRCPCVHEMCSVATPPLYLSGTTQVACHLYDKNRSSGAEATR